MTIVCADPPNGSRGQVVEEPWRGLCPVSSWPLCNLPQNTAPALTALRLQRKREDTFEHLSLARACTQPTCSLVLCSLIPSPRSATVIPSHEQTLLYCPLSLP